MIILSHRGYWRKTNEKNSLDALRLAIERGFGLETDIRDHDGQIVISHEMPQGDPLRLEEFLEVYKGSDSDVMLALNVKADGLQQKLRAILEEYNIKNYFVFDMSIPDSLGYIALDFNLFTRQSEYERVPAFYEDSHGVWIDCFSSDWIEMDDIHKHLAHGKKVCIVSPELHQREYHLFWERLAKSDETSSQDIMICTDFPEECREVFNG